MKKVASKSAVCCSLRLAPRWLMIWLVGNREGVNCIWLVKGRRFIVLVLFTQNFWLNGEMWSIAKRITNPPPVSNCWGLLQGLLSVCSILYCLQIAISLTHWMTIAHAVRMLHVCRHFLSSQQVIPFCCSSLCVLLLPEWQPGDFLPDRMWLLWVISAWARLL